MQDSAKGDSPAYRPDFRQPMSPIERTCISGLGRAARAAHGAYNHKNVCAVADPGRLHQSDAITRGATTRPSSRSAAAGDRQAMERLLMRAQEVAYRFSLLVCGHPEDAEDVMQDALLKTYQYLNRIDRPDAFRTWLYTTVRNACLMKRRRRAGEPAHFVSLDRGVEEQTGATARRRRRRRHAVRSISGLIDDWMDRRLREALEKAAARVSNDRRDAGDGRAARRARLRRSPAIPRPM